MSAKRGDGAAGDEPGGRRRTITDPQVMRALAHPLRVSLLEVLTVDGPMTASQAAERLGETPGNMSWHLQTLARYGFVEEAGGGKGRRRPWQAVRQRNSFDTSFDDVESAAASEVLESTFMERYMQRVRGWWAIRPNYPRRWRRAAFMSESLTYMTVEEMEALGETIVELMNPYRARMGQPGERPEGSVAVQFVAFGHPLPPYAAPK